MRIIATDTELEELRESMARAWGEGATWIATGTKVADLVHFWLREIRDEGRF